MADNTAPSRRQSDGQFSLTTTAAVSYGMAGGGSLVLWVLACLHGEQIIMPSNEVALFLAASLAPIAHAIGRVFLFHLNRAAGAGG